MVKEVAAKVLNPKLPNVERRLGCCSCVCRNSCDFGDQVIFTSYWLLLNVSLSNEQLLIVLL